jgi:hypothetical protein
MRGVFTRKSELERLLETGEDAVHMLASSLCKGKVIRAGLIAGGFAALTAASAGISSLRRRDQGTRGGS